MARQEIELGWMNITPCVKVEWRPFPQAPVIKTAAQRLTGYVSFDAEGWRDDMIAGVKDCAIAAFAAAGGIGALSGNPGAFYPVFVGAFMPCVTGKFADTTLSNVHLDTRTVCEW